MVGQEGWWSHVSQCAVRNMPSPPSISPLSLVGPLSVRLGMHQLTTAEWYVSCLAFLAGWNIGWLFLQHYEE